MKLKSAAILIIVSIVLVYLVSNFIFRGDIKILVHNDTQSEQKVWLTPQEEHTYLIPTGKKRSIKYSTEDFQLSLTLNYLDTAGNPQSIVLSEYVEKHESGTVRVKMKQEPNKEVELEIIDNIN